MCQVDTHIIRLVGERVHTSLFVVLFLLKYDLSTRALRRLRTFSMYCVISPSKVHKRSTVRL